MKLEIGMYVRTDFGEIAKIISSRHYKNETGDYNYLYDDNNLRYGIYDDLPNSHVIKASHNIIDLIEIGDYVNGIKITLIHEPSLANCNKRIIYAEDEKGYLIEMFDDSEIKSIVTKEQFENISYKVK